MDMLQMEPCSVRRYFNTVFTYIRIRAYTNCSPLKDFSEFNFPSLATDEIFTSKKLLPVAKEGKLNSLKSFNGEVKVRVLHVSDSSHSSGNRTVPFPMDTIGLGCYASIQK